MVSVVPQYARLSRQISPINNPVPSIPSSGAVVTRDRSSTVHPTTQELAGSGVKRPSDSFLTPSPPHTTGSTPVNGAITPVDLKRGV